MSLATVERSPRFYARLAGVIYLSAMGLSIVSQMFILGRLVQDDPRATANNILASEGLFRLGIAIDLCIAVSDVVIAWAFYELLRAVDRSLALVGALLRVVDGSILAITTLIALLTLRLLSGVSYLLSFDQAQLQSLARLSVSARGLGSYVAFVFLGLGSAIFAYLLLKSAFVPKLLAGWGVFASLLLAIGSLLVIVSPTFAASASMIYMVPMFFYEVPLGLWFLIKGVAAAEKR